jgi:hypothetical protein
MQKIRTTEPIMEFASIGVAGPIVSEVIRKKGQRTLCAVRINNEEIEFKPDLPICLLKGTTK